MSLRLLINIGRSLGVAALVAGVLAAPAHGQTPEGTVIRNIATVTFTDANSNAYAAVADTVDVTVGFVAGIDVIAAAATVGPASPSTADTIAFQVSNVGNGTDSVAVSENISVGGVITVTGYRFSGTTYGSLAALNAALSGAAVAGGGSITIQVIYDVAAGTGGVSTVYELTATSRRDGGASDNDSTTITPDLTAAVAVTPDGGQNLQRLPSNGTNYTFTFTVTNNATGPDGFDLLASFPGTAITIVSVNGVAGDSTQITGLAAGASQNIDVVYSIGNVAAGTVDTLFLTGRSLADPLTSDAGFADMAVVRPLLSIAKEPFRDDQTTPIGGGDTVAPGEFIQYRITVTNGGSAAASSVHVDDLLPGELTFASAIGDAAGWSFGNTGNDVDADLSGTLATGASRFFWVRASVN
jgi:uncharacterized repeat protein (TIGR01451 family)